MWIFSNASNIITIVSLMFSILIAVFSKRKPALSNWILVIMVILNVTILLLDKFNIFKF